MIISSFVFCFTLKRTINSVKGKKKLKSYMKNFFEFHPLHTFHFFFNFNFLF